jgi:hypothetical protein
MASRKLLGTIFGYACSNKTTKMEPAGALSACHMLNKQLLEELG